MNTRGIMYVWQAMDSVSRMGLVPIAKVIEGSLMNG